MLDMYGETQTTVFHDKKEIQNNNNKRENYIKKLNDLNKKIKNEKDLKKTITEDMQNLDDIITNKIHFLFLQPLCLY